MNTIKTFEDVMDLNINEVTPGTGAAHSVLKNNYDALIQHRNLRTYSTTELLHSCPRKFAIKKLQASHGTGERMNSPTFAFGHSVGAGVAVFDATQDMQQAIWAAFLAWDMDLFERELKDNKRSGKSFAEAVWALYVYRTFREEETDLQDYESIGIEKTVAIDFEDGHFYSGHIDELLKHRITGRIRVKENKTTGLSNINPSLYSNSDQALSYAIVVDMIDEGTEYEVMYTIYSSTEQKWVQYSFVKQAFKKAEWVQDGLLINQQLDAYSTLHFFPKRGGSCYSYGRACEYYETCDITFASAFGKEYAELPMITSIADIEAVEHVDYATTMSEIVARQKTRNAK